MNTLIALQGAADGGIKAGNVLVGGLIMYFLFFHKGGDRGDKK